MDRKTLEYMEERTKKARVIVKKLEYLLSRLERANLICEINFGDSNNSNLFTLSSRYSDQSQNQSRLISMLKPLMVELITKEIALLETELTEL